MFLLYRLVPFGEFVPRKLQHRINFFERFIYTLLTNGIPSSLEMAREMEDTAIAKSDAYKDIANFRTTRFGSWTSVASE